MGPDFLGVGTTRSGTTFLHVQLRAHPQVWMPPQKELHYFSFQRAEGFGNRKHRKHLRKIVPSALAALRGKRGPVAELAWQARYLLGPRNDEWLLSLYDAHRRDLVVGQLEPTYAVLSKDLIAVIHQLMPDTRLIFMMRDPIDRAWSSVVKSCAKNKNRNMKEVPEEEMFEKLDRSALRMSRYIDQIERWESSFPEESFHFGFFDEIVEDPAGFLTRVCRFLGIAPPTILGADQLRPINDSRRFQIDIPPHVERYIAEQLIDATDALQRRFGGYTVGWHRRMERVLESTPVPAGNTGGSLLRPESR